MLEYQPAYFEKIISPGPQTENKSFFENGLRSRRIFERFHNFFKNYFSSPFPVEVGESWRRFSMSHLFHNPDIYCILWPLVLALIDDLLWFIYSIFIVFSILEKNLWVRRQREIVSFFLEITLIINDYLKNLLKGQYSYLMIAFFQHIESIML